MKKVTFIISFIPFVMMACNSGGNSSVPAYSQNQKSDSNVSNVSKPAATMAPTEAGRILFQQRCATCHGLDGNARNNNAANLQFTRLDSLSIAQTIITGKGTMPPFKDAIADSDIAHLAIYVKSIRQ